MLIASSQCSSDEMEAIATAAFILQGASNLQGNLEAFQDVLYSSRSQRKKRAVEPSELGLRIVYEPSDKASAVVDVILVHGLCGNSERTWTAGQGANTVNWPTKLLPQDLPMARIMLFGYEFDDNLGFNEAGLLLFYQAFSLRLATRSQTRPLIFIAHSLGGIVVKAALLNSHGLRGDAALLFESTKCILFFGTPDRGSDAAGWQQTLTQLSSLLESLPPTKRQCSNDRISCLAEYPISNDLLNISTRFLDIVSGNFQVVAFYEARKSLMARGPGIVVSRENVRMGLPGTSEVLIAADSDHTEMAKFKSRENYTYKRIVAIVKSHLYGQEIETRQDRYPYSQSLEATFRIIPGSNHLTEEPSETSEMIARLDKETDNPDSHFDRLVQKRRGSSELLERERQFLNHIKSSWLEEPMIPESSPGSCEWITSSLTFASWKQTLSQRPFCILGRPGTGKTVISKYIADWLRRQDSLNLKPTSSNLNTTHKPHSSSAALTLATVPEKTLASSSSPTIDIAQEATTNLPTQVLSYFFDARLPNRNKTLDLLHSLIYQLLSNDHDLFQHIYGTSLWEDFHYSSLDTFRQCLDLFLTLINKSTKKRLVVIIDALDECELASRSSLLGFLSKGQKSEKIMLILTTRPLQDITHSLQNPVVLNLDASGDHRLLDIESYINLEVDKLSLRQRFTTELNQKIKKCLKKSNEISFIWVQLTIQTLQQYKTSWHLEEALEKLSTSLPNALSEFLSNIKDPEVILIIYFTAFAQTPLRTNELSALLACFFWLRDKRKLGTENENPELLDLVSCRPLHLEDDLNACQPLVKSTHGVVNLAHFQVKNFLESSQGSIHLANLEVFKLPPWTDASPEVELPGASTKPQAFFGSPEEVSPSSKSAQYIHGLMARYCFEYIVSASKINDGSSEREFDPFNFRAYASQYWPMHFRHAGRVDRATLSLLESLLTQESVFTSWRADFKKFAKRYKGVPEVKAIPKIKGYSFTFCAFDLLPYAPDKISPDIMSSLKLKDSSGQIPLHLAAANNCMKTVKWILGNNAAMFRQLALIRDDKQRLPLHRAVKAGHSEMTELILDGLEGVKRSVPLSQAIYIELIKVSMKSQQGALFGMLLKRAPVARIDSKVLPNIFKYAVIFNDENIFKKLQQERPDFELPATLLQDAVDSKSESMVALLLNANLNQNALYANGDACIHKATRERLTGIVKLLLSKDAAVNAINSFGETPLHIACKSDADEIFNLLLASGAAPSLRDNNNWTALHHAAAYCHIRILSKLLQLGLNVNVRSYKGETPLSLAVAEGHIPAVKLLLNEGAELDDQALELARGSGDRAMEDVLLQYGRGLRNVKPFR